MELELSRVDYTVVGVVNKSCIKLLPTSKSAEPQKIAVADSDGILQVFSIKKQDIQLQFRTLPGPSISCIHLGGEYGTAYDKIFVSSDTEVRGYTRKGKLFLSFDSNMTESITSMFVLGNDLFLCGKHIYNHYKDCKDIGSYLCGDCIVDVVVLENQKTHRLISLIACEGRMIRALEHARVTMSMEIESSPTVLHIYENQGKKYVMFGTIDGRVGILDIDKNQAFSRWIIQPNKQNSNTAAISCIESYYLSNEENKNLIVGRQDGNVEVYFLNIEDSIDLPKIIFLMNCNESVSAIQCGFVGDSNYAEVVVATYTGRIFGLTTQVIEKGVGADNSNGIGNYVFSTDTSQKIAKLKNEVEELQHKIIKERERYQASTQSFLDEMSAIPLLSIQDSMVLSKPDSSYVLALEVPTAIDNVLLQSDVPLYLLDVEKNSAVVSFSEAQPNNGNYLLATYRCQINTNRLELKIRTIEGQSGTLKAYITPLIQPKCCQLKQYEIRPLSMHYRIYNFDDSKPNNTLVLRGSFSLAEIHSWMFQCIPEVPEKPQFNSEATVFYFQSTFLDTTLKCSYKKGEGEFKSDNISTIAILRDFLSKEATKKKIKIDISVSVNDESIGYILKFIEPKLQVYTKLSNDLTLLEALHELGVNDEDTLNQLSPKYKDLLENEKKLQELHASQPSYLDRLYGIITDLYVDYYKFKGINVKSKVPNLVKNLDDYNYENLLYFFRPELAESSI